MFVIKKILAAFFLPPGLFVLLLLVSGLVLWRKKSRKAALFNSILAVFIWIFSLLPVSDFLTHGLESGLPKPQMPGTDVIIVLSGYGDRLGPGIQLQKKLSVPILFAGYVGLSNSSGDRENFYSLLESWGVPRQLALLETRSRDTLENLRQTQLICRQRGFRQPLIVSSAFHGKRILLCLKKLGFQAEFYPADFNVVGQTIVYSWRSGLPEAKALLGCSTAINEYLGLLFYRILY
jgi:uncharacterized SAM-binding protein YcdF (DUF218 family)